MIDMHSHIIFGVDDGAKTIEESIAIIEEEIKQGVTKIICTPHYRKGMFEASSENIKDNFNILKEEIKKRNLSVEIYLGREIFYNNKIQEMIRDGHLSSLNDTKNYLIEFSYTIDTEIDDIAYEFNRQGLTMIIAHIERYQYIKDINYLYDLKALGALIQINASTICGVDGKKEQRKVFKYIKHGLVDFVASDIHYSRHNHMVEAYNKIVKKFGEEVAVKLFNDNANNYLF